MFNEKFMEVISHDGVVSITSWADNDAHVVNTWNKYLQIIDNNKLLIPAAGMKKTQKNIEKNQLVKLTLGSHEVMGNRFMGIGYLIEGTAEFITSGPIYDDMKIKFPFLSRVLTVTVTSVKQTI